MTLTEARGIVSQKLIFGNDTHIEAVDYVTQVDRAREALRTCNHDQPGCIFWESSEGSYYTLCRCVHNFHEDALEEAANTQGLLISSQRKALEEAIRNS